MKLPANLKETFKSLELISVKFYHAGEVLEE